MNRPPVSVGSLRGTPQYGPAAPRGVDHPEAMPATLAVRIADAAVRAAGRRPRDGAPPGATCATRSRGSSASSAARLAAALPAPRAAPRGRSASAAAGPRLLRLGELERVRDELADPLAALQRPPRRRARSRRCARAPARHRWVRVTSAELGEPGCRLWQVRPRLGLIGMLPGGGA